MLPGSRSSSRPGHRLLRHAFCSLILALPWQAQALDLLEAWQRAERSAPQYAAARQAYLAAQQRPDQARADLLPSLFAGLGAERNDQRSTHDMQRVEHGNSASWSLTLSQPLWDPAAWHTLAQSRQQAALAGVDFALARQNLMLAVAQAYFEVLAAEDNLSALAAEKQAVRSQLAAAIRQFELGSATVIDRLEAQTRLDLVLASEFDAIRRVDTARDNLRRLTGADTSLPLDSLPYDAELPTPQPAAADAWAEQARDASLIVLQGNLAVKVAEQGLEAARAGHSPTLSLQASSSSATDARFVNQPGARGRPVENTIGLQLSIPIYQGGGVSARVSEQTALAGQARYAYESARQDAALDARSQFNTITAGLARTRALRAGAVSGRASVQANRTGYMLGVRINQDVLDAEQQLYQTLRDLASARYDTLLASLRLRAASGVLDESDLAAINALLRTPQEPGMSMEQLAAPVASDATAVAVPPAGLPAPAGILTPAVPTQ